MKTVKSVADLKQLALARGARVELGNTRFNTTNERVKAFPKPTPAPAPMEAKVDTPPPAPMPPPEIKVDMSEVAAMQAKVGEMLAAAITSMPKSAPPVREWLFTVERDQSGLLTAIKATAKD